MLTFLQAASDDPEISTTLRSYIHHHLSPPDSIKLSGIVAEFLTIPLDYHYTIAGYPERRLWPRSTFNLISIAAVQAKDTRDFMQRIIGILPNEYWLKLLHVMTEAEPYYDKMIGAPYGPDAKKQIEELAKYSAKTQDIFNKLKSFYGSTWSSDIPFTISMYTIPGDKGSTTASPHNNSIVLGVMAGEKNLKMSLCIAIHEMCHMLYLEQSLQVQKQLDDYFSQNNSIYSKYAYGYFDEALATACGNGWSYKTLSGSMNVQSWYAHEYIDGYGHAIYPMVARYINEGKQLDKIFVDSSVTLFEQHFPKAIYDYRNLLNNVMIYTDAKDHEQFMSIISSVQQYFTMHTSNSTYPIADEQSMQRIDNIAGSQLFIVHTNHNENFSILKNKFPQLKSVSLQKEGVISFFDDRKRPVIIINVNSITTLDKALAVMAAAKEIDPDKIFTPLD